MDVDNDNFYDDIASFMPTPGEYIPDDWDEIIRSTDSQLDASLDLNIFSKSLEQNEFDMDCSASQPPSELLTATELATTASPPTNVFNFNFSAFPSPATSHQSSGSGDYTSLYETSERTSSSSSVDGDCFNPDDFINFLNDDDIKIDTELTRDTIIKHNERNTPSPTGSCASSSGSSTSGIQSDISSIISQNTKAYTCEDQDELSEFIKFKRDNDATMAAIDVNERQNEVLFRMPAIPSEQHSNNELHNRITDTNIVPLNMPIIPMANFQPIQKINVVQSSTLPVPQTVPLHSATSIKIENKATGGSGPFVIQTPVVKQTSNTSSNHSSTKVTPPPPNAKPKTIFLSSNDFKALMQKMKNTNGGGGGGQSTPGSSRKNSLQNGQMPKIIMKTASGKYITGNKMPASSAIQTNALANPSQQSTQMPAKLFKSSVAKHQSLPQQPTKAANSNSNPRSVAAMAAAARASLQHSKGCRTDFNMMKGLSEEKLIKKQLRMLKNRESASLSRKKKKEYVERLEYRISNLEKENYSLKGENASLRSQLMAFAKTCDCKHRNVSEFILNTLSMNENRHGVAGTVLDDFDASFLIDEGDSSDQSDRCDEFTSSDTTHTTQSTRPTTRHVRIAPKPLNASASINKNFRHRMNASTVKKNVAVLFAMAFMVTLNVGNFQSYLNKSALENALEATAGAGNTPNEAGEAVGETTSGTGRRLLWVPNEHEFQEQNNRSKREVDLHNMPPPPLHFLRPTNRTTAEEINGTTTKDEPPIKTIKYGQPIFGNGTHYNTQENNMRLARNLHKWIGGNDYLNLTDSGMGFGARIAQFKFGKPGNEYEDYNLASAAATVGIKQKRKNLYASDNVDGVAEKQKKYDIDEGQNSLGLFKPRISEEYLKLFKGIKRQDDTFYVLSFNLEHILLPASAYNKSARPKMSLMLPAGNPSLNGDIVLMQIDCEVLNTTEIELKSHMIPEKLRPIKYGPNNVHVPTNDVANNETKKADTGATGKVNVHSDGGEIHLKREEDSNEKPAAPRTYFMMGPKNQSYSVRTVLNGGETVIKKRPTIVKLNANDSVIGSGIMNVRNSTLFTRMKDTLVNSNGVTNTNGFVATATSDVRKLM